MYAGASDSSGRKAAKLRYPEYLGHEALGQGLKTGTLFRAVMRLNASDRTQGFATLEGLPSDLMIRVRWSCSTVSVLSAVTTHHPRHVAPAFPVCIAAASAHWQHCFAILFNICEHMPAGVGSMGSIPPFWRRA